MQNGGAHFQPAVLHCQTLVKLSAQPDVKEHDKGQYAKPDKDNPRAGIFFIHKYAHANQYPRERMEIVQHKIGEVKGLDFPRSRFGPDVDENASQDEACEPD
jgi:hypothetical protein